MDYLTYAQIGALNWSTLKHIGKSPKHFKHVKDHGDDDTASRVMLRACHSWVLEPKNFKRDFALCDVRRDIRTAKYKDWLADNEGKSALNKKELHEVQSIGNAARKVLLANMPDGETHFERVIEFKYRGQDCKARLDCVVINNGAAHIIDMKTVADINVRFMENEMAKKKYHGQLAFYREAVKYWQGVDDVQCSLLAVESAAPHDCAFQPVDDDALWAGQKLIDELIDTYTHCKNTNLWPGQYPDPVTISIPAWAVPDLDEHLDI